LVRTVSIPVTRNLRNLTCLMRLTPCLETNSANVGGTLSTGLCNFSVGSLKVSDFRTLLLQFGRFKPFV
jgi:hypothetical protein